MEFFKLCDSMFGGHCGMGCAAGSCGLPSPKACVTKLQAMTWELKSFALGENEFQFSDTPGSVSLPPPAPPSFPVSHPGVPEEDTASGLDLLLS